MVALCAAAIPTLVIAEDVLNSEPVADGKVNDFLDITPIEDVEPEVSSLENILDEEKSERNRFFTGNQGKQHVKIRGMWGEGKDNESDGYWGGRLTVRRGPNGGRVGVIIGVYNKTDSDEMIRFVGILKKGYFNGKIIDENGSSIKITGLYTLDRENKLLKMQWMVPHHGGWAVARLSAPEME